MHGEEYLDHAVQYIIPCIGHLAVAAGREVYWKPLNKYILNKSRNDDYQIRLVCVKVLHEFYSRLGEEFLVLLPETVPFLAELMEDTEEDVQKACQDLSAEIQKHLGEDLNSFFS
ncbi:HEAT repeat-containing protein 1 [Dinochytrium kinnereticum]|nr:HEAT repeat-containing protein 1 [Dinochytrium kinnereticum]